MVRLPLPSHPSLSFFCPSPAVPSSYVLFPPSLFCLPSAFLSCPFSPPSLCHLSTLHYPFLSSALGFWIWDSKRHTRGFAMLVSCAQNLTNRFLHMLLQLISECGLSCCQHGIMQWLHPGNGLLFRPLCCWVLRVLWLSTAAVRGGPDT